MTTTRSPEAALKGAATRERLGIAEEAAKEAAATRDATIRSDLHAAL